MSERSVGLAEIARVFLRIGAMSYGGPAIIGIMQAEIQEKREWIGKKQFVEGLSLVNMLPGPVAAQLAIYIGHERGGVAGGVLAGRHATTMASNPLVLQRRALCRGTPAINDLSTEWPR